MSVQVEQLPAGANASPSGDRARLVRRAKLLSWASLGWMGIEGAAAVIAGLLAGSIALIGFGIDSAIEGMASVIIIWRFSGGRSASEDAERRAQQLVAVSFFLLAPYVAIESVVTLVNASHAETTWAGMVLAVGSIIVMPLLGLYKQRLGAALGSSATAGEGRQNLLCAYLAAAVLVGLLANTILGFWWVDPVVGLGIAGLAVWEGREAWRGETCSCAAPITAASGSPASRGGGCSDGCGTEMPAAGGRNESSGDGCST